MKLKIFLLAALLILTPLLLFPSKANDKKLESGGIIKSIKIPKGSIWAYVKIEALIDTDPATLWKTIIDIEAWPTWLPTNERAHFISQEAEAIITQDIAKDKERVNKIDADHPNNKENKQYSGIWHRTVIEEYDLIWPLKNEWVIRRYDFDESNNPYKATWCRLEVDKKEVEGSWEVSPWKDGKRSLFKYNYKVEVKKGVPKPIFKIAAGFTINSMIKSLRREVIKRQSLESKE